MLINIYGKNSFLICLLIMFSRIAICLQNNCSSSNSCCTGQDDRCQSQDGSCYCDQQCVMEEDCCLDYAEFCI